MEGNLENSLEERKLDDKMKAVLRSSDTVNYVCS
jgi:hypothetical protein